MPKIDEVLDLLHGVKQKVDTLSDRVVKLEEERPEEEELSDGTRVTTQGMLVPPDIKRMVSEMLGDGYKVAFTRSGDTWMLTIIVPPQHASTESQLAKAPEDKRSFAYLPHEGPGKVRERLELIKQNIYKDFQRRGEPMPIIKTKKHASRKQPTAPSSGPRIVSQEGTSQPK